MTNISPQFLPLAVDDSKSTGMHIPGPHRAAEDDYAGAQDTILDTGKERQPWSGTGRLGAPQKGALTTRERNLSLVSQSGDSEPHATPSPIQEGAFGSYAFKMG